MKIYIYNNNDDDDDNNNNNTNNNNNNNQSTEVVNTAHWFLHSPRVPVWLAVSCWPQFQETMAFHIKFPWQNPYPIQQTISSSKWSCITLGKLELRLGNRHRVPLHPHKNLFKVFHGCWDVLQLCSSLAQGPLNRLAQHWAQLGEKGAPASASRWGSLGRDSV